jgi:hypothetical protein
MFNGPQHIYESVSRPVTKDRGSFFTFYEAGYATHRGFPSVVKIESKP